MTTETGHSDTTVLYSVVDPDPNRICLILPYPDPKYFHGSGDRSEPIAHFPATSSSARQWVERVLKVKRGEITNVSFQKLVKTAIAGKCVSEKGVQKERYNGEVQWTFLKRTNRDSSTSRKK